MSRESNKFTVFESAVNLSVFEENYKHTVILLDYRFWSEEITSALQWMNKNFKGNFQHKGMLLAIELESDLTLFTLRYS